MHSLLSDPDFVEIESVSLGILSFILICIITIFCYWAGYQCLEDYARQLGRKFIKKKKKKISIYKNQDDIV